MKNGWSFPVLALIKDMNDSQLEYIARLLSEKKGRYRKLRLPLTEREHVIFNTLFGKEDDSTR